MSWTETQSFGSIPSLIENVSVVPVMKHADRKRKQFFLSTPGTNSRPPPRPKWFKQAHPKYFNKSQFKHKRVHCNSIRRCEGGSELQARCPLSLTALLPRHLTTGLSKQTDRNTEARVTCYVRADVISIKDTSSGRH